MPRGRRCSGLGDEDDASKYHYDAAAYSPYLHLLRRRMLG